MHRFAFLAVVGLAVLGCQSAPVPAPPHVYLVATGAPATSMVVQFHSAMAAASRVEYGTSLPAAGEPYAASAEGAARQIPGLRDGRHIHAVTLSGLLPATRYYFRTATGQTGQFTTLPADQSPLRVLFGGDLGVTPEAERFLVQAAKLQPDVAILGGDICYDDGKLKRITDWDEWFRRWQSIMVQADGDMIPMVVAIGNHEINDSESEDPAVLAPFYVGFFEQGGKSFFQRDLSPLARVVVLDSGYLAEVHDQTPFLKTASESAGAVPYLIGDYHVALFPTYNSFDQDHPTTGREHWVPSFDAFDYTVSFEHHDHSFKRTMGIRDLKPNPEGTVYLGDGCMGQEPREARNAEAWYITKAEARGHFWLADISKERMHCQAVDIDGKVFDEVDFAPRTTGTN